MQPPLNHKKNTLCKNMNFCPNQKKNVNLPLTVVSYVLRQHNFTLCFVLLLGRWNKEVEAAWLQLFSRIVYFMKIGYQVFTIY